METEAFANINISPFRQIVFGKYFRLQNNANCRTQNMLQCLQTNTKNIYMPVKSV